MRPRTSCDRPFFKVFSWKINGLSILGIFALVAVEGCGVPTISPVTFRDLAARVVGGDRAKPYSWPWQALFTTYDVDGQGVMCGATIISRRWLLTAAHCTEGKFENSFVQLGAYRADDRGNLYKIDRQISHPNYEKRTISNDIALLHTTSNMRFNDRIQPICLTADDRDLSKEGEYGYVTGWGVYLEPNTTRKSATTSNYLLQARVPFIDQNTCRRRWSDMTRRATKITSSQVCAGSYLHGTAPGDSGGPLQAIGSDERWYQIGITSFGANDEKAMLDQGTYPGVYTRVSAYLTWINDTTDYLLPFSSATYSIHQWSLLSSFLFCICVLVGMR